MEILLFSVRQTKDSEHPSSRLKAFLDEEEEDLTEDDLRTQRQLIDKRKSLSHQAVCVLLHVHGGRGNGGGKQTENGQRESIRSWLNGDEPLERGEVPAYYKSLLVDPIEKLDVFYQHEENKNKRFVFFLGDTHGCWKSYPLLLEALNQALIFHPKNVDVVISGDLADRFGTWDPSENNAKDRLGADECMNFVEQMAHALQEKDESNALYILIGNHDTQSVKDFNLFSERLELLTQKLPIYLCSNFSMVFSHGPNLCHGRLVGDTLFFLMQRTMPMEVGVQMTLIS